MEKLMELRPKKKWTTCYGQLKVLQQPLPQQLFHIGGMRQIGIQHFLGDHLHHLHFGMKHGGQVHKAGIQPSLGGHQLLHPFGMIHHGQVHHGGPLHHLETGIQQCHGGQLPHPVIGTLQFHIGQAHLLHLKILSFHSCLILVNLG